MNTYTQRDKKSLVTSLYSIAVLLLVILFSVPVPGYAVQARQKSFASPEEAVTALVAAMKADNMKEMTAIFGPAGQGVLSSGDAVEERTARDRFLKAFDEKKALVKEGDRKVVLQVGNDDWPFPIPIVERNGKWSFDTKAGKEELLNRRIGRNELSTIQVCLAYVDAQREYASEDRDGDGLFEYAQKFISTPGKKDGLYWVAKEGEEESPLGDFVAQATSEGYRKTSDKPIPYHGYFFRILKAQGKSAPGGAYDYLHNGRMIGGFAMIAYPARYGVSGVMTFMVNHEGTVYQRNLGKGTARIARSIRLFDPDGTWKKVEVPSE